MEHWIDMGNYWMYPPERGDSIEYRNSKRLSSTKVAAVLDLSPFDTADEVAEQIAGLKKKTFSAHSLAIMQYGLNHEDDARQWYSKHTGNKVLLPGHAVPKWCDRLGGTSDGIIGEDGLLEIKCPQRFYSSLIKYQENKEKSTDIYSMNTYLHIPTTHFYQMQTCMAIMNRKWCDYLVFCIPEEKIFKQRIYFMKDLWDNDWYPKIQKFLKEKLQPLLG